MKPSHFLFIQIPTKENERIIFLLSWSFTIRQLLIETFMDEVKLVFFKNYDFDYLDLSKIRRLLQVM